MIPFIDAFGKINEKISMVMEWIALFMLIFIMVLTCIDVIGSKVFNMPIFGAIDMVMISQLLAISFATGMVLYLGRHIQVDLFILIFPKPLRYITVCIVNLLGCVFFMMLSWRLYVYGFDLQISGEASATARIPFYPFVYGSATAFITVFLIYLQRFLQILIKGEDNES